MGQAFWTNATLSSMSCSGGEASVMADTAEGRPVSFPGSRKSIGRACRRRSEPLVAVANPLDYNTYIWANEPAMTATFSAMVSGGFGLNMLVLDFPRTDRCSDADWWWTINAFEAALKANDAKGAVVASMGENLPEGHAEELFRRGIVPLLGIAEAMDAAAGLAAVVGEAWRKAVSAAVGSSPPQASPIPLKGECTVDEAAAKALLASAGLSVPAGRRAGSVEEAVDAASRSVFPSR